MASNFSFLEKYWIELALLGETAESYLYSDPNACIFKIGMLAEQIVRGIFAYEKIELPEDTRQSNLIRVLKYRSIIPENIDNILYSIRRARNDAVHVGCESTDRARILLEMAYNLCIWYMEVYGDWSFVAAEYVEPADISSKKEFTSIIESHEEKLKELLEEINRMKTDASEKSAEERKEKAETVSNALEVSNDVQGYIQKESVRMDIEIMPFLNFALQKNKVNIVQSLIIQNDTDENLEDIDLKVKSVPEICLPYEKHIEIVPAKTTVEIKDIKLIANVIYLGNLTEKEEAYITFSLNQGEREICVDNQPISALAFDEWHGSVFYPELLTAFVTPNAPIVSVLIKRASEFLKNWTSDPSLDAYQSNDAERVMKQAAAVYAALQEQNITYAVPPASFERAGQRVRLCDMVISQKLGTCLDLTLLYVSCIEAIGLHPVLVLLQGHIFAGVWLQNYTFPDAILDDAAQVTKRLASGVDELIVVECTAFCSGKKFSFDEACDAANAELRDGENVQYIIDVHRARMSGITPLPSRIKTESGYSFASDDEVDYVTSAPKREINALDIESSLEGGSRTKKEMWERKLLDLSLRNKLINMSLKSVIPILTDSIDTIEDILSDGKDLYIFPRPQDWHILSKDLNFENMHDLGPNTAVIHSELENKRLRSALSESEVLTKLKGLYRSSKLSIEENGANTLYIALGLLKWYESERSRKARYAPLLLMPVEIIRKGGNQGYVIRRRDEETQMNITVFEKLNQDFQIRIAGLETLPIDEHGIDTRKTFTIIRKGIMNQSRWDVLESAYIGIFSFSQFVMWNDIKNRADDLARNKIVHSLMEGKLVWKPESMNLNEYVSANDLYLPVSVDGSQMYAVDSAAKGKSFVLHGPPGTGKSQTITVMIANALAQGKTVLFVAEKMAALSVVQKRLNDIGLGSFCLELHSNKAKKKDVLEQLRQASEVVKGTGKEEYERKLDNINKIKEDLDKYAVELHKVRKSGFTFFEMINQYENYAECEDIKLEGLRDVTEIDRIEFEKMERNVERLIVAGRAIGHPCNHPLSVIGLREYSQSIKERLERYINTYLEALKGMQFAVLKFAGENSLKNPETYESLNLMVEKCVQYEIWYQYPAEWALQDKHSVFEDIEAMAQHFAAVIDTKEKLLTIWNEDFLKVPVSELLTRYNEAVSKWFLPKMLEINKLAKSLMLYSKGTVDRNHIGENLLLLKKYQDELNEANQLLSIYQQILGNLYQGDDTDWEDIANKAKSANDKLDDLMKVSPDKECIRAIFTNEINPTLVADIIDLFADMKKSRKQLEDLLVISREDTASSWFDSQYKLCADIINHKDDLKEWITWLTVSDEAVQNGLRNIVDAYNSGMEHDAVSGAYYKAIYHHLAVGTINESSVLNGFSGVLFNEQISQFKKIDAEITELAKKAIYCILAGNVPDFGREAAKSSEVGILQRAIKSNGRGLSIRSLLDQIPTLLPRLCPCMLMSPLSVAQYLDPNRTPFDLVIFDEASQLPTSKAVGALARGEEAIIVGDPKQMPPTSFFASNMFDEENADTEDLESILDDCLVLNMPETHLLWHYRSRHESLIAFSNNQFYENKLYTFPSVNDRESKVTLVKVNGIFERGKKRFNKKEAELIVEEVKRRAKDDELRKYSVGIVTFNINQQNLIDDMLNDACAEDPELESWIYNETEPVFIKNLENVQGDERDAILFSISYGPDEDGKISMNFGPLNREGGWRRLNVAVSRARYEMKVFSSLSADQINLSRTKAEGVVALKEFLEYAAGKTTLLDEITIKGKGVKATGIAGTIKAFLKNNGYESDILVGRSEFKIDVGVINLGNTENYILGIILDGDSYNAAKTTRDRELAQIAVLNGLGWNIHRIWTMDWYDNQVKELNKLLSLLDELKNTSEKKTTGGSLAVTPKTSAIPIQKNVIEKVVTAEQKKKYSAVVYESVVLSYTPMSADNMLDYHSDEIRKRITQIIQNEGPVCEKFLYKKVVQSFGVTRVGSRIQGRLEVLVGNNRDNVTKQESGKVFWPAGINPDNYYGFRASGENENKRDAKDVPVYEALNAMSYILFNDISVEEEDLIREAAKLMGYARVGTGVSTLFKTALKLGCKNGRLIKEDIRWKLTEEGNIFAKNLGSNVVCEEIVSEELNDELDDIDTTTSKLVAKNIKAKEIAKKCALDKITNCDSNCKFYITCSHAGD